MKPLAYFGAIILAYIWLMAVLSGCATAPTHKPPILIADPQHTINKGMGINSGFLYPTLIH